MASPKKSSAMRVIGSRGGQDTGADTDILELLADYPPDTPDIITQASIKSVPCTKCRRRLGYHDNSAPNLKCAHCGEVTKLSSAKEKERLYPPSIPRIDKVAQCRKCKKYLGVPVDVVSFICGHCKRVNIAGVLRAQDEGLMGVARNEVRAANAAALNNSRRSHQQDSMSQA